MGSLHFFICFFIFLIFFLHLCNNKNKFLYPTIRSIYTARGKLIIFLFCFSFILSFLIKESDKKALDLGKEGFAMFKSVPMLTNLSLLLPTEENGIKNPKHRMIEALNMYKDSKDFANKTFGRTATTKGKKLFLLFKKTYEIFLVGALCLSCILLVVIPRHIIGLLQTGYYMWHGKTVRKRQNKKILNLVYYFTLLPSILWYGFVSPLRKFPKIHGSPGSFSHKVGIARVVIGLIFMSLSTYIGVQVYYSESTVIRWVGIGGILCLLPPIYISFSWAKKALKGYRAELGVARILMQLFLSFNLDLNKDTFEVYWGQTYRYRKNNNNKADIDFDSKAKKFIKGLFGKDTDEGKADVDLIIHNKISNNYIVIEIKSYEAWEQKNTIMQTVNNAMRVEEETSFLSVPVIICPINETSKLLAKVYCKNAGVIDIFTWNYNDFLDIDVNKISWIVINPWNMSLGIIMLFKLVNSQRNYVLR
jgi:hypothetical protein